MNIGQFKSEVFELLKSKGLHGDEENQDANEAFFNCAFAAGATASEVVEEIEATLEADAGIGVTGK